MIDNTGMGDGQTIRPFFFLSFGSTTMPCHNYSVVTSQRVRQDSSGVTENKDKPSLSLLLLNHIGVSFRYKVRRQLDVGLTREKRAATMYSVSV